MTDRSVEEASTPQTPPTPRRNLAPRVVAGGVLVLVGALWLLERLDVFELTVTTVLAIGTIVVGLALMVLATDGPHSGLIVFGTILALVTTLTAAAPLEGFQGGVGERDVEIAEVADLLSEYNLAMGNMTIDLTELGDIDRLVTVNASVGMGELVILVPEGLPVSVEAAAGAGDLEIFDRQANGLSVDQTFESEGFDEATSGLIIEADVFMGRVEVTNG
jgi:predicted membrane protein